MIRLILKWLYPLAYWAGYRDGIREVGEMLNIEYRKMGRIPKRVREALRDVA